MRNIFLTLFAFVCLLFPEQGRGQNGTVTLGLYCGDGGKSPVKQIQKAVRALNAKDYPSAQVYIGAALRVNEGDQHALYLKGEWAIRTSKFELAEAHWKRLVKRCPCYNPDLAVGLMKPELILRNGYYVMTVSMAMIRKSRACSKKSI
jgi:hypothetical protein